MRKEIVFSIASFLLLTGCSSSSLYFIDKENCDKAIEIRNALSQNDTIRPRDVEWKDGKCFSKEPMALSCDLTKGKPARAAELREIIASCGGTLARFGNEYFIQKNLSNESYQNCIKQHRLTDKFYQTIDGMDIMVFEMDKGYESRSTPKEKMAMLCTSNTDTKSLLRPLITHQWETGYTPLQAIIDEIDRLGTVVRAENLLITGQINPLSEETIMYYKRGTSYLYGRYSLLKFCIKANNIDCVKLIGDRLSEEQKQSAYVQEMVTYSQESYDKEIYPYLQELSKH